MAERPVPVLTYDEAVAAALNAFAERHPPSRLPAWFAHSAVRSERFTRERRLEITYYAVPRVELPPDLQWVEWSDGNRLLRRTDPETGKESFLISWDPHPGMIMLFRVQVAVETGQVEVLEDADFAAIEGETLERMDPAPDA